MSFRFREIRERAGLTTYEAATKIGVSQAAISQWENGTRTPSIEMLCKMADLYCVSTDYLLGRDSASKVTPIPLDDKILTRDTLRFMHGKPVWDSQRGWGVVNSALDYIIFMDGSKVVLGEAMALQTVPPAFSVGYSPTAKPIAYDDLSKFQHLWIQPISADTFLREELSGWYQVKSFYVENQYGTRFLFDTYGTRWLAFEMDF